MPNSLFLGQLGFSWYEFLVLGYIHYLPNSLFLKLIFPFATCPPLDLDMWPVNMNADFSNIHMHTSQHAPMDFLSPNVQHESADEDCDDAERVKKAAAVLLLAFSLKTCEQGPKVRLLCARHYLNGIQRTMILFYTQGPKYQDESKFSWFDQISRLSEVEFKKRYRLTTEAFRELLECIRPALVAANVKQAQNSRS